MSKREHALWCLSAEQFVMWELHLYLDTHPDDKKALNQYKESVKKVDTLRREFEECFGGLTPRTASGREWLKNPWPWDLDKEAM